MMAVRMKDGAAARVGSQELGAEVGEQEEEQVDEVREGGMGI